MSRKYRILRGLGVFAAILWAVGIQAGSLMRTSTGAEKEAAQPSRQNRLAGTTWRLVQFQSMDDATGTLRPDDPSRYTMTLNRDGTVSMRLGCRRARGTWSADPGGDGAGGRFEFGRLVMTRGPCSPPGMDVHIASNAGFVRSFLLKNGRLYLSLMADGGIYAWEPAKGRDAAAGVPATPEDGGPRYWRVSGVSSALNLRQKPSIGAKVIARYAPGTILHNLGCERGRERIWCDVQQLGGCPRGYVTAAFLKPAVSPDGVVARRPDDSAGRAGEGRFDATGEISCAPFAGQPAARCAFGVARSGGGDATVVVTKPHGGRRAIFFCMGEPAGADISQADGELTFSAVRKKGIHLIRIGPERYEIPDAVVFGR